MDLRVTTTRLRELYADGELDEDTPVWAQGMAAWRPIKDVWQLQWQLLPAPSKAFLEQASNDKERRRRRRTQALIRIKRAKKAEGEGKESKGTDGDGEDVAEENDLTNLFWGPEKPDEAGEGEGDQESDADSDSEMDGTGRNAYRAEGDPLTSVLEAVQLGHIALDLLFRLVTLHKSIDATGAPVRPPPRAKRLLASSECLPHIAQLVLVGNPDIVDSTSKLLTSVAEHNPTTSAKLYLTGIYYFAAVYTGSNFVPLAKFLCATHLKQAFRTEGRETLRDGTPIRQRSILGEVLPESLLCIMENYGAERFAEVFLGNHDNPEVIWKYEMRQYLIKMVMQHIGDLSMRCQQNTMAKYEYVPIPGLRFEQLEEELLDEQLMDISAPAVGVPAQAAADPAVPAARARAPAPAPEPAASTEEDEFAQLEAQMVRLSPRHTRTHAPTHHAVTLSGLIFDRRFGPVPGNVTMDMCARVVCG